MHAACVVEILIITFELCDVKHSGEMQPVQAKENVFWHGRQPHRKRTSLSILSLLILLAPGCRLRLLGRIAGKKGLEAEWATAASERLGSMADHLVQASLQLAAELQIALFSPDALTSSLGEHGMLANHRAKGQQAVTLPGFQLARSMMLGPSRLVYSMP